MGGFQARENGVSSTLQLLRSTIGDVVDPFFETHTLVFPALNLFQFLGTRVSRREVVAVRNRASTMLLFQSVGFHATNINPMTAKVSRYQYFSTTKLTETLGRISP